MKGLHISNPHLVPLCDRTTLRCFTACHAGGKSWVCAWTKPKIGVFVSSAKRGGCILEPLRRAETPRSVRLYRLISCGRGGSGTRRRRGSHSLVAVFKLAEPSVILLDELVMFAPQLVNGAARRFSKNVYAHLRWLKAEPACARRCLLNVAFLREVVQV
jgi:hypothetical protein